MSAASTAGAGDARGEPLRLMAVLAHPDDESLGVGTTLARYAAEGVETHVVTATLGQAGRYSGIRPDETGHPGAEGLGAIREGELREAVAALGVHGLTLLRFMDGRLDQADPLELSARVARCIREVRPHVVITFAPDGGYGHPDHIAISQATTAAIVGAAGAGDTPGDGPPPHAVSKLYWMAWTESIWHAYRSVFQTLGATVDGVARSVLPWPDWEITTELDTRAHWETAWSAVRCHASQIATYEKLRDLPAEDHEALWGRQTFYRVFSRVNGGRRRETDLFEGLRPVPAPRGERRAP